MLHDPTQALTVHVEATDAEAHEWAWAIHREPDRMLIVRSLPEYADHRQALEAGCTAAADISRKLHIPVVGRPSDAAE